MTKQALARSESKPDMAIQALARSESKPDMAMQALAPSESKLNMSKQALVLAFSKLIMAMQKVYTPSPIRKPHRPSLQYQFQIFWTCDLRRSSGVINLSTMLDLKFAQAESISNSIPGRSKASMPLLYSLS